MENRAFLLPSAPIKCRNASKRAEKVIGLLQRVREASVSVDGETVGQIDQGLMVLCCVHREDTEKNVKRLAGRLLG